MVSLILYIECLASVCFIFYLQRKRKQRGDKKKKGVFLTLKAQRQSHVLYVAAL